MFLTLMIIDEWKIKGFFLERNSYSQCIEAFNVFVEVRSDEESKNMDIGSDTSSNKLYL